MKREKARAMGRIALWVALGTVLALLVVDGSLPGVGHGARADSDIPGTNPLSGDQKAIAEGRSWFRATCSVCHGGRADGAGERGQGADLRVFSKGFRRFVETVKNGKDTGRTMKMPAWGRVLSEQQIYQIGAYLETLALEGANWKAPAH
jgi:mono/diheme cytochrome c family protein